MLAADKTISKKKIIMHLQPLSQLELTNEIIF